MEFFEVGELFPGGSGTVLPSATEEPTPCLLILSGRSVDSDLLLV